MSVSGLFCKDSASEWNDKTKYAVFVFHSRAPPILFKDASEWNDKTKHAVFVFHSRALPILFKDSANRRQYKTSSLVFIVEMQPILLKDSASERNVRAFPFFVICVTFRELYF